VTGLGQPPGIAASSATLPRTPRRSALTRGRHARTIRHGSSPSMSAVRRPRRERAIPARDASDSGAPTTKQRLRCKEPRCSSSSSSSPSVPTSRTSDSRVSPPSRPPHAQSRATSSLSGREASKSPTSSCCSKPSGTAPPARHTCTRRTSRRPWLGCPTWSRQRRRLSTSKRPEQAGRPWPNCNRVPPRDARRNPSERGRLLRAPAGGRAHRASVPRGFIHHIAQRLAGREPAGVVAQDLKPTLRDIVRVVHGNMRRQQHIGQGPQAMAITKTTA
jgi:hypothetical protein